MGPRLRGDDGRTFSFVTLAKARAHLKISDGSPPSRGRRSHLFLRHPREGEGPSKILDGSPPSRGRRRTFSFVTLAEARAHPEQDGSPPARGRRRTFSFVTLAKARAHLRFRMGPRLRGDDGRTFSFVTLAKARAHLKISDGSPPARGRRSHLFLRHPRGGEGPSGTRWVPAFAGTTVARAGPSPARGRRSHVLARRLRGDDGCTCWPVACAGTTVAGASPSLCGT
jgi:hypothetical protein